MAEIVCALRSLQRQLIVIKDLKLPNIMLDGDGHIKLIDFGLAEQGNLQQGMRFSLRCGTPTYKAPEVMTGRLIYCMNVYKSI